MGDATRFSVVLGITGGIAAYKIPDLIRRLRELRDPQQPERYVDVRVVLTAHGAQFVTPVTLQTVSGNAVHSDLFESARNWDVKHVGLADDADVLLIAPASANIMAKLAHGIADDLLSTIALASTAPLLLAPSMNVHMWEHVATRENLRTLLARGAETIGPDEGKLACGYEGRGRLATMDELVVAVERHFLAPRRRTTPRCDLQGRTVLVTAGPTREYLDPVRFLSNPSSGKMGYALATAARARGAEVTLVSGPVTLPPPVGVTVIAVTSADEMAEATLARADAMDIIIAAAAPADFAPAACEPQKMKKTGKERELLELLPTRDIIAEVGAKKQPGQVTVAFAAETERLEEYAVAKMACKQADFIVANDVSAPGIGFGTDVNAAILFAADGGKTLLPTQRKEEMADAILDAVVAKLSG